MVTQAELTSDGDVLFRAEVTRALCLPRVAFGRPLVDFGINDDNKH